MRYESLNKNVTVRVTENEYKVLNELSKYTNVSKSDLIREALKEYLLRSE